MPTRSTPRSTQGAGRFGRTQPSSPGRFGKSQPSAGRFGKSQPPSGRFPRPASPRPGTRKISTPRIAVGRRPAKRSKGDNALSKLTGMLPGSMLGRAAKPSSRGGGGGKGRKAGFAVLAGAAGLALKNRDRLPGPLGRKTEEPLAGPQAPVTGDYVATPPAGDAGSPASTTPPPAV